jgi:acetylornithine deacetylase
LVGRPTLSVGRIAGGIGVNVVPDRCAIEIDRRIIPGEEPEGALAEIDALLSAVRDNIPGLRFEREEPFIVDWALDTPPDSAIVAAASAACREVDAPSEPLGVPYGSDASKLWALARVPSIVLGPGSIEQAHTADEFVPIAQLAGARDIYVRSVLGYSDGPSDDQFKVTMTDWSGTEERG